MRGCRVWGSACSFVRIIGLGVGVEGGRDLWQHGEKFHSLGRGASKEKLQRLETEKTKKMEKTEAALKDELKKEKRRVEEYEQEEKKLQEDIQSLKQDAKTLKQEGSSHKEEKILDEPPDAEDGGKAQGEEASKPAQQEETCLVHASFL